MSTTAPGLVVVDKPSGLTSHDVVARIRRLAGTRRVGHAGTLDPMATGVLLVGVNRATRLLGHLMLTSKAYDATVRLGLATTTDDAEGEVVRRVPASGLSEQAVRDAFAGQVGNIDQVPSSVSAIKVAGERAYTKVRAGEDVALSARPVTVHSLHVTAIRVDGESVDVDVSVRCSSGTYIRAIARDVGDVLSVGGHLTMLRRTAVGPFDLDEALTLDALSDEFRFLTVDEVAARCFPTYTVGSDVARDISYGRKLQLDLGARGPVAVVDQSGRFLALYEQRGPLAAAVAVFSD